MKNQIGVMGLGTMGKALAMNLLSRKFKVAGYNRNYEVTKKMVVKEDEIFCGYENIPDFVSSLEKPRKIILMVPAGEIVDKMIESLSPHLEQGDIIMDSGNSYFKDTMTRSQKLQQQGIVYYGIGVSGGEQGALLGPSIMPGGDREYYDQIRPYLETISAKKDGEPCCAYIGPNGAGHYVKMIHNGIEYADMQLIAEIYLFLKTALKMSNLEMSAVFEQWNETEVKSYLIEITGKILKEKDPLTKNDLVDMIKDEASQKGTGKWTILEAVSQGENVSLIQAAVNARITSNLSKERELLSIVNYEKDDFGLQIQGKDVTIEQVRKAYYLGKIVAYAQGFAQMKNASDLHGWALNLEEIASIFRAGCIIQAKLLEVLMEVYNSQPQLPNLLLHTTMIKEIQKTVGSLRKVNIVSLSLEIPIPVLSAAIIYIDQLKSPCIGGNLIQAQRDFFGAHTFERKDREGNMHHEWTNQ